MNNLPDGYLARPVQMEDLESAVALLNIYSLSQIGVKEDSLETLKPWWERPEADLSTDTLAIFIQPGQMVGYSEFIDRGEPHVRLIGWSCVHPDHWGRGLGTYLLEWSIQRARQNIAKTPEGTRVVLQHYAASTNQAAAALFTASGFQPVRSNYIMRADFEQPPQPAVLAEGITIRPITGGDEERSALYAAHEAFKDHWGNTNPPFEEYYQRFKHYLESDPFYDPSLFFIALDGDQIAGISLCSLHADEDSDMAWVGTLGVRRPWRKRGIGLALLQHSFFEFYRRGKKRAGLGVDAGSLTGAVRLYERAGMEIYTHFVHYRKVIRGDETTLQS
ncbi:MAG: GNAT family N-acetyltransferase [Chloroflexi bacterium]|nr:MAG: GNAT family N-acetyltransferase [Chloroflexota bacterium]